MKKTRILLVLAIAMLAMFAMSACNLVAEGITKVEFDAMPKNYFKATDLAEGLKVSFTVYTTAEAEGVPVTVTVKENNVVELSNTVTGVVVEATGFSTDMGEHSLVISVNGNIAKTTYQYRVCEVIDGVYEGAEEGATAEDELKAVLGDATATKTGFYMLESDLSYTESLVAKRSFVLYGENNTISSSAGVEKTFIIGNDAENWLDGGLYEFNNVNIKNVFNGSYDRALNVHGVKKATININACSFSTEDYYAINFTQSTDSLTVNISNGTTSSGWAAMNIWASNSVFNIDSAELIGKSNHTGATNNFATFVLNASANNVVNMTNVKIAAIDAKSGYNPEDNNGWMHHILVQSSYENADSAPTANIINLVNCMYSLDGSVYKMITDVDTVDGFRYFAEGLGNTITIR